LSCSRRATLGALAEHFKLLRRNPGDFQVPLQGHGQRHRCVPFELDLGLAIELHQRQQLATSAGQLRGHTPRASPG
jgi:hypothetical protein